jgi:hypothetical protein
VPTLNITNGDSAADKLRRILTGRVAIICDVLHEGPAPRVARDAWYDIRARFLSDGSDIGVERAKREQAARDRDIVDAIGRGDDVVFWFEHDLFDQLLLIRALDLVAATVPAGGAGTVAMICIDRFPGVERFIGLGQLTDDQLATLIGTESPVTADQFSIASAAWDAFRSTNPEDLLAVAARVKPDNTYGDALPFLHDALMRFLAEYPSQVNGLSQTEQLTLETLRTGPLTGGALFAATQALELSPFMGDLGFYDVVRALGSARVPLVTIDNGAGSADLRLANVAITPAGREVLAGRSDHVALNGIDCWRGGVHLTGVDRSPWRWDARLERLVS